MHRIFFAAALTCAIATPAFADHLGARFTVRIENVSTATTLQTSAGPAPAPNSPGLWVLHREGTPLFEKGKKAGTAGLEMQAEDGDPKGLAAAVTKLGLMHGVFDTPKGDAEPGPATPGKAYEITFDARPGDRLSLTTMFGQSNDWFYATDPRGVALFDGKGKPVTGDLTKTLSLYDGGTEVDQEPGVGADQAPRQKAPNTGVSESRAVGPIRGSYRVPKTAEVLRVTVSAAPIEHTQASR